MRTNILLTFYTAVLESIIRDVRLLQSEKGPHGENSSESDREGRNPYITPPGVGRLNDNILKHQYGEIVMLCDLAPPTVSECNTTVVNTDLRSVTMC